MTVIHLGDQRYEGLTADTKPTNAPAGALYRDTQLDIIYEYNGSSWDIIIGNTKTETLTNKTIAAGSNTISGLANTNIDVAAAIDTSKLADSANFLLTTNTKTVTNKDIDSITNTIQNVGSFKYTIFIDGSTYYCRNNLTGAIEVSNSSPNTVLQYPLTNGGSVYIQPGTYTLTGNPAVYFDFPVDPLSCHFEMATDTVIVVPTDYAGVVFRMRNSTSANCMRNKLRGGTIKEEGDVTRDWTGLLIEAIGDQIKGIHSNIVQDIRFQWCNIGIKFNNDATCTHGWITTNYFENITIHGAKTAYVDFNMDVAFTSSPLNGIHRNRFINCLCQQTNGTDPVTGFRNIRHKENLFIGCYVADFTGSNLETATIHADATNTTIVGGTMTVTGRFTDDSTSQTTKIMDEYRQTQFGRVTPGISGIQIDVVPTGTSNRFSWWNSDSSERLQFMKTTSDYQFNFTKSTAGGSLRPAIFKQVDVQGSTVESFRIDTDASLKVYTDKLKLLDNNQSHYYNFKTGNITADRDITYPALTGNDIPVFEAHTATLTNKTIDTTSNTITNISESNLSATGLQAIRGPVRGKKRGRYYGTAANFVDGMLGGTTNNEGTQTGVLVDTTHGGCYRFSTAATIGTNAGYHGIGALLRKFNVIFAAKVRPNTITNNRMYVGLSSTSAYSPASGVEDALANLSGVMLLQRSTDTDYQICSNNGGANSVIVPTGVPVSSTTPVVIIFRADEANTKWQWSIDEGQNWTDVSATSPASTTSLFFIAKAQTAENVAHQMQIFGIEVESDK